MTRSLPRGYTLIELLVSLSIFAIMMLAATGAYLSYISYNRQAQTTASVVNALSFSVDSMALDMRTGTGYTCSGGCSTNGTNNLTFTDANGCTVTYAASSGTIVRSVVNTAGCPASEEAPETSEAVTETAVNVSSLTFYVRGVTANDNIQPIATIVVNGSACVPNTDCTGAGLIPFQIETSATQREIDL